MNANEIVNYLYRSFVIHQLIKRNVVDNIFEASLRIYRGTINTENMIVRVLSQFLRSFMKKFRESV